MSYSKSKKVLDPDLIIEKIDVSVLPGPIHYESAKIDKTGWVLVSDPNDPIWDASNWNGDDWDIPRELWGSMDQRRLDDMPVSEQEMCQMWQKVQIYKVPQGGWCVEQIDSPWIDIERLWLDESMTINCALGPAMEFKSNECIEALRAQKGLPPSYFVTVGGPRAVWVVNGRVHREDGPAMIDQNGGWHWMHNGERHRVGGPARMRPKVQYDEARWEWWENGDMHRVDGPALMKEDGSYQWYKNGVLHREDGPAMYYSDGRVNWLQGGEVHRLEGPAAYWIKYGKKTQQSWYFNGKSYEKQQHPYYVSQQQKQRLENALERKSQGVAGSLKALVHRAMGKARLDSGVDMDTVSKSASATKEQGESGVQSGISVKQRL